MYLQVSLQDHIAHSFYTKNKFYNKDNDILHLPTSLQVSKIFFVSEEHILLMICKSGNFNVTTEEEVDDIPTIDTTLIIELKPEIIKKP